MKLERWNADHQLGAGLRTRDLEFSNAEVFRMDQDDISMAESDAGALVVARPGKHKTVVFGFHPMRSGMKYELTTPLLFANILRWMAPDIFRSWELTAGTVGTVDVQMESETDPSSVQVVTEDGQTLPFTVQGRTLRFFAGAPGIVRVLTGDRELVYSHDVAAARRNNLGAAQCQARSAGSRTIRACFARHLAMAGDRRRTGPAG